jgi:hypothetical protein
VRRRQDAEAFGDQHELRNRLNLALLHDLLPMRLDGSFGDIQLMGNLLVELAASHQGEEAWQPDSAARPVVVRRRDQGILQGFHPLVATARRAAECFANKKITGSSRITWRTGRVQFSGWKVARYLNLKGYGDVATKKPGERLECVAYICNLAAGASKCFLPVSDAA